MYRCLKSATAAFATAAVATVAVATVAVATVAVATVAVATVAVATVGMLAPLAATAQALPRYGHLARPAAPGAGHRPEGTDAAMRTITWGGYSVEVPQAFSPRRAKSCGEDKGSFVVVGSYQALSECMGMGPLSGTTVLLGQGGPPLSPIPTLFAADETVHGVSVQELDGTDATPGTNFDTSFLVALLPGRDTWLYMAAPGRLPSPALAGARRILATLRPAPAPRPPSAVPSGGGFVGAWEVHDALLTITSLKRGVISARGDCQCTENDTLSLSLSHNGTQLDATVTQSRATGAGGKVVPDPHPNEVVGQKSFFEFIEPHLMLEATVPNEPGDLSESFGNPYWCGKGLAVRFEQACGA